MVSPHREGLKSISDFSIDSQFAQKYGTALFSYQGDVTQEYKTLCTQLSSVVRDSITALQEVQSHIPSFDPS
jgi:hypothetical protein